MSRRHCSSMPLRFVALIIFVASLCSAVCTSAKGQSAPQQQPPAQQQSPPPQATPPQQTQGQQQAPPPQAASQQSQQDQQAQQPPSLGDVARKYREEKAEREKNSSQPGVVYTNEGILPVGGANALGMGAAANAAQPGRDVAGRSGSASDPLTGYAGVVATLDSSMAKINALAAADRAALISAVLKENNVDFPGRKQWENRLMQSRDYYVAHARQLIDQMRELMAQAKALHDAEPNLSEDDPRVQSLMSKIREVTNAAQPLANDFKSVVELGQALAKQAQARGN